MKHIFKYTLLLLAVLLTVVALTVCASAEDEYMVPLGEGTPPAPVSHPNPTEDDLNEPGGGTNFHYTHKVNNLTTTNTPTFVMMENYPSSKKFAGWSNLDYPEYFSVWFTNQMRHQAVHL